MTSELRPAVEVWRDASDAATLGSVKYKPAADQAAAAVIEADREAVRAEQAAELAKWKALAETLAGALEECRQQFDFYADNHRKAEKHDKAATNERFAFMCSQALTSYKEQRDAS